MKSHTSIDEKTVLTLLDIAGSCITDIMYNHMYDRAIAVHEKTSRGIADCYRQSIRDYVNESRSPKFFSVLLNSIHHYTRMSTIYNDLSYTDCISLYSSLFVPHMYINSLTIEQKCDIVSMIFGNVVRTFAEEIIQQHISIIIDDHCDPLNIEILQDCILKDLIKERDISYDRFIESQKSDKKVKSTPKQSIQLSSIAKLTDAYKKSVSERVSLKKKVSTLQKKNKSLSNQFGELKNMFLKQIAAHKDQALVIQQLKSTVEEYQRQLDTEISSNVSNLSIQLTKDEQEQEYNNYQGEEDDLFSVQYVET